MYGLVSLYIRSRIFTNYYFHIPFLFQISKCTSLSYTLTAGRGSHTILSDYETPHNMPITENMAYNISATPTTQAFQSNTMTNQSVMYEEMDVGSQDSFD